MTPALASHREGVSGEQLMPGRLMSTPHNVPFSLEEIWFP